MAPHPQSSAFISLRVYTLNQMCVDGSLLTQPTDATWRVCVCVCEGEAPPCFTDLSSICNYIIIFTLTRYALSPAICIHHCMMIPLYHWFSTFLHQVPPHKISVSPSTTIILKYRGRDSTEYHQRGAQVPSVVHVPQVENHCCIILGL